MYCTRNVTDRIVWIGGNDRRIALFENVYPIPTGVSYNAYFIDDEKTMVMDTVDHAVSGLFFENIAHCLRGRKLDYLIVNHMEPDHAATMRPRGRSSSPPTPSAPSARWTATCLPTK